MNFFIDLKKLKKSKNTIKRYKKVKKSKKVKKPLNYSRLPSGFPNLAWSPSKEDPISSPVTLSY